MARKMNIPKAKQIQGLRKAIANRKTPKQFLPSLKKRLAKLMACILFALAAASARAQSPVSLVPTQQILAASGTACTGVGQSFTVNNRNQTQHTAILVLSGSATSSVLQIQGVDSSGNTFIISPTAHAGQLFTAVSAIVSASGYYPTVNVLVTCPIGITFTLTYSGSQTTPVILGGTQFLSLIDQQLFTAISGAGNVGTAVFGTPFGNSSGVLVFTYLSSPVSGSILEAMCTSTTTGLMTQFNFPIANLSPGVQVFKVPPATCPQVQVVYVSGGAAGNISFEYIFDSPGAAVNETQGSYTHITGTTATAVKTVPGTLVSVTVNTPAVGTISVFDLATAACTGTPSTNTVAVITATATAPIATLLYNVGLLNGICVKASAAMDFTVSSQ
jgi:hypothetical protein